MPSEPEQSERTDAGAPAEQPARQYDERTKAEAIALIDAGLTASQASRMTGIPRSTLVKWWQRADPNDPKRRSKKTEVVSMFDRVCRLALRRAMNKKEMAKLPLDKAAVIAAIAFDKLQAHAKAPLTPRTTAEQIVVEGFDLTRAPADILEKILALVREAKAREGKGTEHLEGGA